MTTISVVMCTYNGTAYLEQQLNSIAAQTRPADEVIIRDDGSTDGSVELVAKLTRDWTIPVRMFRNEQRLRPAANFERAMSDAAGDLLVLSDQDDVWQPGKLAQHEDFFARHPHAGLVFTDARLVDKTGAVVKESLWAELAFDPESTSFTRDPFGALLHRRVITGATIALRRSFLQLALPFPSGLRDFGTAYYMLHDEWLGLIAAMCGQLAWSRDRLLDYRLHSAQAMGLDPRRSNLVQDVGQGSNGKRSDRAHMAELMRTELTRFATLRERAEELGHATPSAIPCLDAAVAHFTARLTMPAGVLARTRVVTRELRHGRYRRHGLGLRSGVADLVAPMSHSDVVAARGTGP